MLLLAPLFATIWMPLRHCLQLFGCPWALFATIWMPLGHCAPPFGCPWGALFATIWMPLGSSQLFGCPSGPLFATIWLQANFGSKRFLSSGDDVFHFSIFPFSPEFKGACGRIYEVWRLDLKADIV